MRTGIAAGFAALVVAVAAVLGWQAVTSRIAPDEASPEEAFDTLVAALSDGPDGPLDEAVRSGGEDLVAAVEAVDAGLPGAEWDADRAPTVVDDARASTTLTITLATEDLGEVSWETEVEATRRRGEWGIDATTSLLHPDLRPGYQVVVERTDTRRASITDREGEPLTAHGDVHSIGVVPGQVVDEERLLSTWESVLPGSLEDLQDLLDRDDLQPSWYYPLVTVSEERHDAVFTRLRAIPGVISRDAQAETPTDDDFATHVLGRVGQPTAEQMEELGVPADAVVGLRGLERVLEDQLVGSEEVRVLITQPDGDEIAELATVQDDPSGPVTTTLDRTVQEAVENALTGIESPSAVVVVDTATSAIRATASRPLSGYNRAFEAAYPPGDAFLPVPAEALLAGDTSLDEDVACPQEDVVVGAALTAPTALGETTLGRALAAGCDTTLGAVATRLAPADLVAAGERFGFGTEFDLPLETRVSQLPEPVDETELVRAAVGRARVLASPLHVATIVGAAADGTWHAPFLLADQDPGDATDLSAAATEDLRRLLELGAQESGSGAPFGPLDAQGFVGTAPVTGRDAEHAWAVGTVPGPDGDLAFAVVVEDTGGDPEPARRRAEAFLRELEALGASVS